VIAVKPLHPAKAYSSIVITASGIVTEAKWLQAEKA
jgi:hypothetical protein